MIDDRIIIVAVIAFIFQLLINNLVFPNTRTPYDEERILKRYCIIGSLVVWAGVYLTAFMVFLWDGHHAAELATLKVAELLGCLAALALIALLLNVMVLYFAMEPISRVYERKFCEKSKPEPEEL